MELRTDLMHDLRKEYNHHFKTGEADYNSLHNLMWQIEVNKMTGEDVVIIEYIVL